MQPITLINYPLDMQEAWAHANKLRPTATPYRDKRYNVVLDNWLMARCHSLFIEQLVQDLGMEGDARYYWQQPNSYVPDHVDNNTKCGINFILSEEPAPITIQGVDYFYKQAVIDTTQMHSVRTGNQERVLLKISIYNNSYIEVVKKLGEWVIDV